MTTRKDIYREEALLPFVEKLLDEYYCALEKVCLAAEKQAARIIAMEVQQAPKHYAATCTKVIQQTLQYINGRKEKSVPYVRGLAEKVASDHNCAGCVNGCKVGHDTQLLELTTTNEQMKKVVNQLQLAILPLYTETLYPDQYRILRNQMAIIETNLTELFFLENNYLIPKVIEAQKTINAGSK